MGLEQHLLAPRSKEAFQNFFKSPQYKYIRVFQKPCERVLNCQSLSNLSYKIKKIVSNYNPVHKVKAYVYAPYHFLKDICIHVLPEHLKLCQTELIIFLLSCASPCSG